MRGRFPVGAWNPRSGPHPPSRTRSVLLDQKLADPANGETVPRCRTCGSPDLSDCHLLDFELYLGGRRAGSYRICERCFWIANPPEIADPLDVQTA
jgi:hypothetical protein